ncbi:hypothetical protein DFQ14_103248 [Halopolyspora algeriensis]|uniref:Ribbon-helix-helix CopG family protein n=1 Tax=Halopolyspora algeriensis TaxID=1500506 RepID=A0A368VTG7_9ACTN|nr:hypothetical protein [Halopolyspora algeriensis]RCW45280.1 hypothetical protein DFQ14_103248 [Halopolyspora algeriensis]TQM47320.1 hypothetical protein FHU43_3305 [Halopolyspora algeriensis]
MNTESRADREAAEAEWLYEHRNDPDLEGEEEEVTVAKPLAVTTSLRMTKEESAAIQQAAQQANMSQSEWIRKVCMTMAERPSVAREVAVVGPQLRRLNDLLREAREVEGNLEQEVQTLLKAAQD